MESGTQASVLVVDDDRDTCANLADILGEMNYHVDTAYDAATALELVERRRYDVALLDLKLPDIDGVELFRRIRQLQPATVGMIVTAYATIEAQQDALRAGACQVLAKPVNFHKLLRLVGEALDRPLVLVVDDDLDLCDLLRDLLEEQHIRVCMAHDAAGAERRLKEARCNVVLVDMKLPQGDGGEVFRRVRATDEQARVVMITGYRGEMEHALEQVLAEGADAVCYKPFNVPQLLDTIGRLARSVRPTAPPPLQPQ
jgi:DNA-binding NtrC family response regulator